LPFHFSFDQTGDGRLGYQFCAALMGSKKRIRLSRDALISS
jgi:hypothetical protein